MNNTNEMAITASHVQKSFGAHTVLKDITLNVYKGEIFTLLGENGAGKTTLIQLLTTLMKADAGRIEIQGVDVGQQPHQVRERISLNAQANSLDEEFTGYENLLLIAQLRGVEKAKMEIDELTQRLDLGDFLNRKVSTYSGGMRRRLDIAMSLIGDPSILFLDEPTTGVDPKNRLEIWKIIKEIRAAGKTIFLTTQYLEEADKLSDHIAFVHNGEIVLYGTPENIKERTKKVVSLQVAKEDFAAAEIVLQQAQWLDETTYPTFQVAEEKLQNVIELLVENQILIQKIMPLETDLERIFLNITRKEAVK